MHQDQGEPTHQHTFSENLKQYLGLLGYCYMALYYGVLSIWFIRSLYVLCGYHELR